MGDTKISTTMGNHSDIRHINAALPWYRAPLCASKSLNSSGDAAVPWYKKVLSEALDEDLRRASVDSTETLLDVDLRRLSQLLRHSEETGPSITVHLRTAQTTVDAVVNKQSQVSDEVHQALQSQRCIPATTRRLQILLGGESIAEGSFEENRVEGGATIDVHVQPEPSFDQELYFATKENNTETLSMLLLHGAGADVQDMKGFTPVNVAASLNNTKAMRLLLDNGADADQGNEKGWTPVLIATHYNNLEALSMLLDYGADANQVNKKGQTPVLVASGENNTEALKILLDHGADADQRDVNGWTPVLVASGKNNTEALKILLDHGADAYSAESSGMTPVCAAAVQQNSTEALKMLLDYAAKAGQPNQDLAPAMLSATFANNTAALELLSKYDHDCVQMYGAK